MRIWIETGSGRYEVGRDVFAQLEKHIASYESSGYRRWNQRATEIAKEICPLDFSLSDMQMVCYELSRIAGEDAEDVGDDPRVMRNAMKAVLDDAWDGIGEWRV